jgi:RNA polymerase sigma factor (sigma-70 family)
MTCTEAKTCKHGHELTPIDSYRDSKGTLSCRVCHRVRGKLQNARRKAARQARKGRSLLPYWYAAFLHDAQQTIIEENKGLAWWFVDKYFPTLSHEDRDEAVGEAFCGLVRAARSFDPNKGAFTTYAHWWMRSYVHRWFDVRGKPRPKPMTDCRKEGEDRDCGFERISPESVDTLSLSEQVDRFRRLCYPLDWLCLWRSSQGDTLRTIAADMGVSLQRVTQRLNRAKRVIRWNVLKEERVEARR